MGFFLPDPTFRSEVPSLLFLKVGREPKLALISVDEAKDDLELPTLLLEPWEDVLDVI